MVYPAIVMTIATVITTGLIIFIVPRFESIFKDILRNKPLPLLTQKVLGLSEALSEPTNAISLIAVIFVIVAGYQIASRNQKGAYHIDSFKLKIPVIGLAKREEEVFLPRKKNPVKFPSDGPALRLLKQTRDEAHRFAISYHKKRRTMKQKSSLDNIPGIGTKRRNALLEYFGSVDKIRNASVEELCQVDGISRSLGETIFLYLNSNP